MQVVGNARLRSENFNGVSDKLKKELIKPVNQDEIIYFQLLNGVFDAALGREAFGASRSIPMRDRIWDKYAVNDKGEEVGAYVEIGVPDPAHIKDHRVERCKKFWVESIANGVPGNGEFELMSNNIEHMEIYEFLCLANGNKNNPYRGKSKEPLYFRKDIESMKATQQEKDFRELQAKLKVFAKHNPEKAKELSELIPKEVTAA